MTGVYTDDYMPSSTFRKVAVRRTFLCIDRVSEKMECRPRALTDDMVCYGSYVHSDSRYGSTSFPFLPTAGTFHKTSVTSQSIEAATTSDGEEPKRSISFTSEDWGSDLCDTASGDTDDVISLRSCVTSDDCDMTGMDTDGLPLGRSTGAASIADDDDGDSIGSTFFASKSNHCSPTDGKSSELAGDVEGTHGKAQPLGDERKKAKTTRSWQRSGRARQREKARRRERTPSPGRVA
jgi:hypothetical protein